MAKFSPMKFQDTACKTCEHYKETARGIYGVCFHPAGPTGKVFDRTWGGRSKGSLAVYYPPGCPKDPEPPEPPRARPGMEKRRKGFKPKDEEQPKFEGMAKNDKDPNW